MQAFEPKVGKDLRPQGLRRGQKKNTAWPTCLRTDAYLLKGSLIMELRYNPVLVHKSCPKPY